MPMRVATAITDSRQAADHAGQRSVHAGGDDNGVGADEVVAMPQQPMDALARGADVGEEMGVGAEGVSRDQRLAGHGQIAGASG